MNKTLTALLLATATATATAQTTQPVAIQGWVIQQPDPQQLAIQQQQQFAAIDAWSKHMEDQYYQSLQRSNAHMNCVINTWHPENCD